MRYTREIRYIPVTVELDGEPVCDGEVGIAIREDGGFHEQLMVDRMTPIDFDKIDPDRISCKIKSVEETILYIAAHEPARIGEDE